MSTEKPPVRIGDLLTIETDRKLATTIAMAGPGRQLAAVHDPVTGFLVEVIVSDGVPALWTFCGPMSAEQASRGLGAQLAAIDGATAIPRITN